MELSQVIQKISTLQPKSIFLYGSQARGDAVTDSDFELGVIAEENQDFSRTQLKNLVGDERFSVYPFKYQELLERRIDTPFQKNMYLYELISSAKTVYGEELIEHLPLPEITPLDCAQEVRFNLWYALTATLAQRNGNAELAKKLFYKSCLYGTRILVFLHHWTFPIGYQPIFEASKTLELWEFGDLVSRAFEIRMGKTLDEQDWYIYKNIKYLSIFVEPQIIQRLI